MSLKQNRIATACQEKSIGLTKQPYLFRSYHHSPPQLDDPLHRKRKFNHDNFPIWKVARATSAAPTYFKSVKLIENNDDEYKYIDGGWGCNNPTEEVYRSIKQLNDNDSNAISMIVSIGTGEVEVDEGRKLLNRLTSKLYFKYVNSALKLATDSETTHHNVIGHTRDHNIPYFRLNVKKNLGNMKLDAFHGKDGRETLMKIQEATNMWLTIPEAIQAIRDSAQKLVDIRRRRAHYQGPSAVDLPPSGPPPAELPSTGPSPTGLTATGPSPSTPSPSGSPPESSQADTDWRDRLFLWERFVHGVAYRCRDRRDCRAADNDTWTREGLRSHLIRYHGHEARTLKLENKLDAWKIFL